MRKSDKLRQANFYRHDIEELFSGSGRKGGNGIDPCDFGKLQHSDIVRAARKFVEFAADEKRSNPSLDYRDWLHTDFYPSTKDRAYQ